MPWYYLLIFGAALVAATAVVVYLLVRRVRVDVDRVALATSREARTQAMLEAERRRRERLEEVAIELRGRLEGNRKWFEERLNEIDDSLDDDYRRLLGDDDALLGRLAELLRGGIAAAGAPGEGPPDEGRRAGADGGDPPDAGDARGADEGARAEDGDGAG